MPKGFRLAIRARRRRIKLCLRQLMPHFNPPISAPPETATIEEICANCGCPVDVATRKCNGCQLKVSLK